MPLYTNFNCTLLLYDIHVHTKGMVVTLNPVFRNDFGGLSAQVGLATNRYRGGWVFGGIL